VSSSLCQDVARVRSSSSTGVEGDELLLLPVLRVELLRIAIVRVAIFGIPQIKKMVICLPDAFPFFTRTLATM